MAAGRELLRRLAGHLERREDFAVETTLSSEGYARMFPAWRARGYRITLHYLEARSADFAVARVARRIAAGGHAIPEADIRRRHARGLALFERVYRPAVDVWYHHIVDEQGPAVSIKVKTPTDAPQAMSGLIDESLRRATVQATEGPRELRAGRYRPELAARFEATPRPAERGHVPGKVQGGNQPSTSQHGKPPTGGSAVKPKAKT